MRITSKVTPAPFVVVESWLPKKDSEKKSKRQDPTTRKKPSTCKEPSKSKRLKKV